MITSTRHFISIIKKKNIQGVNLILHPFYTNFLTSNWSRSFLVERPPVCQWGQRLIEEVLRVKAA